MHLEAPARHYCRDESCAAMSVADVDSRAPVPTRPSIAVSFRLGAHSHPFVPLPTPPLQTKAEKHFRPSTRVGTCPCHWELPLLALRWRSVESKFSRGTSGSVFGDGHEIRTSGDFICSNEANKAANPSPDASSPLSLVLAPPGGDASAPERDALAPERDALVVWCDASSSLGATSTFQGAAVGTGEDGGVWPRSASTMSRVCVQTRAMGFK